MKTLSKPPKIDDFCQNITKTKVFEGFSLKKLQNQAFLLKSKRFHLAKHLQIWMIWEDSSALAELENIFKEYFKMFLQKVLPEEIS